MQSENKPTIFISHSSSDLTVARAARNLLEDRDHHVLLLGLLQPLSDDDICALLDAEIQAREWLVLIDTENARNSSWVQFEIQRASEYDKAVYQISGDRFTGSHRYEIEQSLLPCIESFSRGLRTFLSYSRHSSAIASTIHHFLQSQGFESWHDQLLEVGGSWRQQIEDAIDETLERGVFIPLVGPATLTSPYLQFELEYALNRNGMILPILVGDVEFRQLPPALQQTQYLDMRETIDVEMSLSKLLETLNDIRHTTFNAECGTVS